MIKSVQGTKDILPFDIPKWRNIEEIIRRVFSSFNYKEIRTPIFEKTELFARGIGETTDIVGKEMYTFLDKGKTSLTLRPEMTASVGRAYIEHSLSIKQPLWKLYYIAPMFRQERPQAGRLRQFHQFGAEALGSSSPFLDVEMIAMPFLILSELGLKNLTVVINSLGSDESRENFKLLVKKYLSDKTDKLSEESRKRYETNILRIFDSKEECDIETMKNAPSILDHIDEESKKEFEILQEALKAYNIPYDINSRLVRGLDYYSKTAFEIVSGSVGSQNALCGGGRYDGLIKTLGGEMTPGVGFAAGIERILLAAENEGIFREFSDSLTIYIVRLNQDLTLLCHEIAAYLRGKNISVDFDFSNKSVKAQMREANRLNAKFVLFIGGDEYNNGELILKIMSNGEQIKIPLNSLELIIKRIAENAS